MRVEQSPVLVVEDDAPVREAIVRLLRGDGIEVLEAADCAAALGLARGRCPSLLLLDCGAPGMDEEALLSQLRAELGAQAPPAILLTASDWQQRRVESLGAVEGLPKPFAIESLMAAIHRHRRGSLPDA